MRNRFCTSVFGRNCFPTKHGSLGAEMGSVTFLTLLYWSFRLEIRQRDMQEDFLSHPSINPWVASCYFGGLVAVSVGGPKMQWFGHTGSHQCIPYTATGNVVRLCQCRAASVWAITQVSCWDSFKWWRYYDSLWLDKNWREVSLDGARTQQLG